MRNEEKLKNRSQAISVESSKCFVTLSLPILPIISKTIPRFHATFVLQALRCNSSSNLLLPTCSYVASRKGQGSFRNVLTQTYAHVFVVPDNLLPLSFLLQPSVWFFFPSRRSNNFSNLIFENLAIYLSKSWPTFHTNKCVVPISFYRYVNCVLKARWAGQWVNKEATKVLS